MHDHRGIPAQLKHNFLFPSLVLDRPSDRRAPGKADELDTLIRDEQLRILVREQQHVESAIRPTCLLHHFRQQQCAERRLGRRFQHHGTSGGHRRSNLVRHQIQRKIKW